MLPCVLEQFFCVQYAWCLSPIIIPGDETAHRNHGEYVTANSRKHLDAPSKSISFWYLQTNCSKGWQTDGMPLQWIVSPLWEVCGSSSIVWMPERLTAHPSRTASPAGAAHPPFCMQPRADGAGAKQENHFPIKQQRRVFIPLPKGSLSNPAAWRTFAWHVYSSKPCAWLVVLYASGVTGFFFKIKKINCQGDRENGKSLCWCMVSSHSLIQGGRMTDTGKTMQGPCSHAEILPIFNKRKSDETKNVRTWADLVNRCLACPDVGVFK